MISPIEGPTVWKGTDFADKESVSLDLRDGHLAALGEAVESTAHLPVESLERAHFDDGQLHALMAEVRCELCEGRGLVVLRGFPADDPERLQRMFWGLSRHLGNPVSQSVMGERIGHVVDRSQNDPNARGYRQRYELTPHTDFQEIVTFLCAQQGLKGGVSWFVSGHTLHNEVLSTRPDLLEALYDGYHTHRFGEQESSETAITPHRVPVFSTAEGFVSCRLLRRYIEAAANEATPLSKREREALEYLDSLSMDKRFGLLFTLEAGEAVFMNNYVVFHGRTAFEDGGESNQQRHLARIWLTSNTPRPLDPRIFVYASEANGQGIAPQPGKLPSYDDRETVDQVYGNRMPTS